MEETRSPMVRALLWCRPQRLTDDRPRTGIPIAFGKGARMARVDHRGSQRTPLSVGGFLEPLDGLVQLRQVGFVLPDLVHMHGSDAVHVLHLRIDMRRNALGPVQTDENIDVWRASVKAR